MKYSTQLLGISNAIVDILTHVEPEFIADMGATVGAMNLIDEQRAETIYRSMGPATEMSGGSVANTVAGFANLGGDAAYIGHVHDDQLGKIFNHDMRSLGVDIRLQPASTGAPTARSFILITPDAQRTMNTYLGSCTELAVADITDKTVGIPKVILLEGYVWDIPEGPALARKTMEMAAEIGATVALSLSDAFCVERHHASFMDAVVNGAYIVIADENEINALMQTENFDESIAKLHAFDNMFVMTRSAEGSVIAQGETRIVQAAMPVEKLVDTTGAGDAYSAGFLYGWANDWQLEECARLGTHCATRVIQQLGARIEPGLIESYKQIDAG
ncbi:MAG TPA: adenosine kinase [Woeseiaceae bacterium]|nr:adenosine kinase [Woeseiaceae bacterium]